MDADVNAVSELRCPACQAPRLAEDRFCERCGARLAQLPDPPSDCTVCGADANAIDPDGYCSVCGARAPSPTDRIELDLVSAAAISDRGRVHRRNEDAFHLAASGERDAVAVVCDGISSASAGDTAAKDAARAAGTRLVQSLHKGEEDRHAAVLEAVRAAGDAVAQVPWTTRAGRDMPSCTMVLAIACAGEVLCASVGDSRAYWVGDGSAHQLTEDDSWVQEQVREGLLTTAEAERDPRAHTVTHWIGADAPPRLPRIFSHHLESPGRLVLCSDGLWNYLSSEHELAALIDALPAEASAAAVARALADTALARGGRDNITVAVLDLSPDTT